jgi:hypothetical protein
VKHCNRSRGQESQEIDADQPALCFAQRFPPFATPRYAPRDPRT